MDTPTMIGMVSGVIATIIALNSTLQSRKSAAAAIENENRLTKLETRWEIFYASLEKDIGKMVHSPHREELDRLIEKNLDPNQELSRDEARRLAILLDETLQDPNLRPGEDFGLKLFKASIVSRFELREFI